MACRDGPAFLAIAVLFMRRALPAAARLTRDAAAGPASRRCARRPGFRPGNLAGEGARGAFGHVGLAVPRPGTETGLTGKIKDVLS
jgi:hypothetical protein